MNQSRGEFTHRKFAELLRWPTGLLADVVSKRRALTSQRCIEFALYAKFSAGELEKLLFLSMKDSISSAHNKQLESFSLSYEDIKEKIKKSKKSVCLSNQLDLLTLGLAKWISLSDLKTKKSLFDIEKMELDESIANLVNNKILDENLEYCHSDFDIFIINKT